MKKRKRRNRATKCTYIARFSAFGNRDSLRTSSCASNEVETRTCDATAFLRLQERRDGIIDKTIVSHAASSVIVIRGIKSMPGTHSPMTFYSYLQVTDPPWRKNLSTMPTSYLPRLSTFHFREAEREHPNHSMHIQDTFRNVLTILTILLLRSKIIFNML